MQEVLSSRFFDRFQQSPLLVFAPGRINLIGEHTDYNLGFVMPAAIHLGIQFAIGLTDDGSIEMEALDLTETYEGKMADLAPSSQGWANYLLGICAQLKQRGIELPGFRTIFSGNIPVGSGLSSSAALECGFLFALNELLNLGLDRMQMAKIAQAAEHSEYVGVQCGIMDQFASLFGQAGQVVQLDCRSMEFAYAPVNSQAYEFLLVNTKVSHSLADSEYNTRRLECEEGVRLLQAFQPELKSLRDVKLPFLKAHASDLPPVVYQRCLFIVEENARVEACAIALKAGDMQRVGELMYASHHGLQHQYQVSCSELDFLVDQSRKEPNIIGARMMGGGFGGCTINLVPSGQANELGEKLLSAYQAELGLSGEFYVAEISQGVHLSE